MSDNRPNCYNCVWRQSIPGNAHSACGHPDADPIGLIAIEARGRADYKAGLTVVGAPHGIKNGWFLWPINFDPVWLNECNGFEEAKK